jgi:hypothetical protein
MLYHVAHDRLYLGYDNGDINYIDLAGGSTEQPFATSTSAVGGLGDAGNFLLVQDVINTSTPHYFFDADGGLRNETTTSSYSREYAWNPWLDRLFFSDDNASPSVLAYEDIDQASGEVLAGAATPYWEFLISPPIRISSDGARVMVGTGHIFDAGNLDWLGSIPGGFVDARWRDDDGTVVVRDDSGNARVERRDASRNIVEFAEFDGVPLAMMPAGPGYLVVSDQGRPGFHWYVPTDDSDGDGVANTVDAFPFDVAASIDSDGDGYPDAWNPGMGVADSTTGLAIDAYPNDSACFLLAHGDGTNCDVTSTLPDYLPSKIEIDNSGVVYLFSPANQRVYRWSAAAQSHVNPLIVGRNPWLGGTTPAIESYHAAHHRLYLGYQNGDITYIDLGDGPGEQLLNRLPEPVLGIADVGAFLMTQDNRKEGTDSIFDANGTLRHSENNTHFSNTYEWAPVPGRLYQFRDDVSPNDILYRPVDQSSGQIGTLVDSPYHGAFEIKPPIRVSPNGSNVLLGSGDIYDANSLVWLNRMPAGFADVRWTDTGGTVMLQANGTNSQVVRRDNNGDIAELVQFSGEPLAILPFGDDYVVVTDLGGPMFAVYVPNDDTDGDGVMNADDAFPLDPAASVDSDGDGYPDAWNPGKSEADSTTGLVLDAYPNDFACYLPEHGDGVSCDLTSTIPHYLPTSVMIDDAGVVYLFSPENRRIYRWDAVTREHLNPFVIGPGIETGGAPPRHMAYQSTQFRLYFGYDNGEVTFIDLAAGPDEQNFLTRPVAVLGLADVGNFLLLHDSISGRTTSVFDADGTFLSSRRLLRNSLKFVWNPVLERVYFLRDDVSPNDIHYQTVDQATGALGLAVDSPYNGGYQIQHPIRISSDGSKVLVGGGDVFNAGDLTWLASISTAVTDAAWLNDGRIATIRADGPNTIFEVFGTSYTSQSTQTIPDLPIASMHYNGDVVVITQGATPEFIVITP